MTSLRGRLLVWLIGLLTAVGALAGLAAYWLDREEVAEALDTQLAQIAVNVGSTDRPATARMGDGYAFDPEDIYVITIWEASGERHSSIPSIAFPKPSAGGYANLQAAGEAWRSFALVSSDRTVEVAQRIVVREEFAANSALRAVLPIVALVPLSWMLVGWVVGRVLRPLRSVTSELQHWEKTEGISLSLHDVPDEVMPLAFATNDLITRLHAQLEFRKAFISDAAHELRTPLTALRLQGRNLRTAKASSEREALAEEMELGFGRMSDMITQMLRLARADGEASNPEPMPTDLDHAIAQSVQAILPLADDKGIDVGLTASHRANVRADPDDLRTLIGNLVDNAVRYTPPGGTVDLRVSANWQGTVLEVKDTGPGIPDDLLDRVFDRFYRVAGSETEGSGLGLSIVRTIAERYGAKVSLKNGPDGVGLVARVCFAPGA
jgi:two-component system OmpR family sensor kinase/two-component system sensor histidine kinase QseC